MNVPATATLASKVDLGLLAPSAVVQVTALGYVELYSPNHYLVFADGSQVVPFTGPVITWASAGGAYPTFAGGDGINHYPDGGTNWNGSSWSELGAQSTDTLNPNTIRFGTLVGTFKASPAAGDWFVLGRHAVVTAPPAGGHLYAAVIDCGGGCETDDIGGYSVTVGSRLHSLRDDFAVLHNPNGPWTYGFRLATDPPTVFTPFADHYFGYIQIVGGWLGMSQYGTDLPGVSKNYSENSVTDGPSVWLPHEVLSHPGQTRDCVVRFAAPAAGVYKFSGSLRGMSVAGTTSTVIIRKGAVILFQANVTGYQTVVPIPLQSVTLAAGEVIDLTVTKGRNNDYNSDSTGLHLVFEQPVCTADTTGNGVVNIDDLLAVINAWGPCAGCAADIAPPGGNGIVNIDDLLAVINGWGACP